MTIRTRICAIRASYPPMSVVVGVPQPKYTDEKGITYIGVMDFLLDPTVLDGLLK